MQFQEFKKKEDNSWRFPYTSMYCLMIGIHSEKRVISKFYCCMNFTGYMYTNLGALGQLLVL
jgi:hypothetical protein